MKCWGYNGHAQLGLGDSVPRGAGFDGGASSVSATPPVPLGTLGLGDTVARGTKPGDMEGLGFVDLGTK